MYLMPTISKYRLANVSAGVMANASYHVAKIKDGELLVLCGSHNAEGPATELDRADVPIGVCYRCKQIGGLK